MATLARVGHREGRVVRWILILVSTKARQASDFDWERNTRHRLEMVFSLGTLLEATLLTVNGVAVLQVGCASLRAPPLQPSELSETRNPHHRSAPKRDVTLLFDGPMLMAWSRFPPRG